MQLNEKQKFKREINEVKKIIAYMHGERAKGTFVNVSQDITYIIFMDIFILCKDVQGKINVFLATKLF